MVSSHSPSPPPVQFLGSTIDCAEPHAAALISTLTSNESSYQGKLTLYWNTWVSIRDGSLQQYQDAVEENRVAAVACMTDTQSEYDAIYEAAMDAYNLAAITADEAYEDCIAGCTSG